MSILVKRGVVMPIKYLFTLLSVLALSAGCNLMDRPQPPNIAETPPYWQPRSELANSQLAEMRAFHERESAKISEDMRVARNREMDRLAAAGKELERNQRWQEDYEKTQERRANWMSWFRKTNKDAPKDAAPSMVSRIGGANQNTR